MNKTYIVPSMAGLVIVQRASHSEFKDPACKYPLPRIAHAFERNSSGCAQFSTDDVKAQEFIESRPTFKDGTIVLMNEAGPQPTNHEAVPQVRQGAVQSKPAAAPEAPAVNAVKRGGAKTAIK